MPHGKDNKSFALGVWAMMQVCSNGAAISLPSVVHQQARCKTDRQDDTIDRLEQPVNLILTFIKPVQQERKWTQ